MPKTPHNKISSFEAEKMVMMFMITTMPMVMTMMMLLPINRTPHIDKLRDATRDRDRTLMIKPILLFGLLQQLQKQGMIDIHHWHHKPLQFLLLFHPDQHRQTPFGDFPLLLPPVMLNPMSRRRSAAVEAEIPFFATAHLELGVD